MQSIWIIADVFLSARNAVDKGVYYGARDFAGIQVVSPVQVYLDLLGYRGRGKEAAKELLEQVIRPSW